MHRCVLLTGLSAICVSLLLVWMAKAQLPPASSTEHPRFRITDASNEGAGFGQLSPGTHVLRVTYEYDPAAVPPWTMSYFSWQLYDETGASNWFVESRSPSSVTSSRIMRSFAEAS